MTLAVLACWPWGRLRQVADSLPRGAYTDQAVILAADSRFTMDGGRPVDTGRKVYRLATNAGMAFSGRVLPAQRAISDIGKLLRRVSRETPSVHIVDPDVMAGIFRNAYDRQRKPVHPGRRRSGEHLHVLIGFMGPGGRAYGLQFSSRSARQFAPLYIDGVHGVGDTAGFEVFRRRLDELQEQRWQESHLSMDPAMWQVDVVAALRAALEHPARSSVIGGVVQSLVITKAGVTEGQWSWTTDDPMKRASWHQATAATEDLNQLPLRRGPS